MDSYIEPDVQKPEETIAGIEMRNEVVGSAELIEEALRTATPVTICSQNVTDD